MQRIPDSSLKVLEYLHTYRFLTVPQLMRLGLASHRESVYKILRRLKGERKGKIVSLNFGVVPGIGKLPSINYMTKAGAEILSEAWKVPLSEINFPKGKTFFSKDYFHRISIINFQIELRLWAQRENIEVKLFETYFDMTGSNRSKKNPLQAKTKVELESGPIIPDAVFMLQKNKEKRYLYAVEIHNGRDTKRIFKQIYQYVRALTEGVISEKYGYDYAPKILLVFEQEGCKRATIEKFENSQTLQAGFRFFLFKTLEEVEKDVFGGWLYAASGRRTELF